MAVDYEELRQRRFDELDDGRAAAYARSEFLGDIRGAGLEALRGAFAGIEHAAGGLREGVTVEEITIPGPAGSVPAKLYRPDGAERPGLYVHFHSGGFVANGGLDVDGSCSAMVSEWGCAVLHPDFRLPPEHKFPAGVQDSWAVMEWLRDNLDELGLDRHRVAVGGGCTGANMAAVMALMARDAGGPEIALQDLSAPQLDCRVDYASHLEFANGYGLSADSDEWSIEQYLDDPMDRFDWRASPVLAETFRGLPTAVISVGEWEVLRDMTRHYRNRLRDAGVTVHYLEGAAAGHGYNLWRDQQSGALLPVAAEHEAARSRIIRAHVGQRSESS